MNVFEDAGYFCVDNLPPEMIRALVELFVHEGSKVERAAVVSDVRGGDYFEALRAVLEDLEALGLRHRVLFLHADRRRAPHALPGDPPAPSARAGRRPSSAASRSSAQCSSRIKGLADVVIDSTGLTAHMLRRRIADEFLPRGPAAKLAVSLESFGFKHGPARDADIVARRALPAQPALRARRCAR